MNHDTQFRDPQQVIGMWDEAAAVDPLTLRHVARGHFWDILRDLNVTLLVTREYEHLLVALRAPGEVSYLRVPHPSGLAVDRKRGTVHVACTRNPNQVMDLRPLIHETPYLVPLRTRFYAGCLYLHDLAMMGNRLLANAVGQNCVVALHEGGQIERAWWPRCVEHQGAPRVDRNYLQLNSIAAGRDLEHSYFSASTDRISRRLPGHRNFAVDRRGVIFSGATREPVARGLTRPHSARLHQNRLYVDDSGYGELVAVEQGRLHTVARLGGWTRGLALHDGLAFVGTSRVLPRFQHYAPGLVPSRAACGVHVVELSSGKVLGSLVWPTGDQIFALELVPAAFTSGFPFSVRPRRTKAWIRNLFYRFATDL